MHWLEPPLEIRSRLTKEQWIAWYENEVIRLEKDIETAIDIIENGQWEGFEDCRLRRKQGIPARKKVVEELKDKIKTMKYGRTWEQRSLFD